MSDRDESHAILNVMQLGRKTGVPGVRVILQSIYGFA
jgi:hypothetical protein